MKAEQLSFITAITGAALAHVTSGPAILFPVGTLIWLAGLLWMGYQSHRRWHAGEEESFALVGRAVFAFVFYLLLFFFLMVGSFRPS